VHSVDEVFVYLRLQIRQKKERKKHDLYAILSPSRHQAVEGCASRHVTGLPVEVGLAVELLSESKLDMRAGMGGLKLGVEVRVEGGSRCKNRMQLKSILFREPRNAGLLQETYRTQETDKARCGVKL